MIGIAGLLRHSIVLVRDGSPAALDAEGDDRGHPGTTPSDVATYAGLIQPKTARERLSVAGSDVNVGSHRIYLEAAAIGSVDVDDRLRKDATAPDADLAGEYRIVAIANAAGMGHHLEVDADLIRA